jgi:hypothetical protein
MKGSLAMRRVQTFPAVIPFPQRRDQLPLPIEPLRATSEFPPTSVELQQVEREELRQLRVRLLEYIRQNEQQRRAARPRITM